jgi:HPt (histidine-containing phosphotransfer) domain-containing protein
MNHDETTELGGVPISASLQLVPDDPEPDLDISAFDNLAEEIGREGTLQTFSLFFEETTDRLKRMRTLSCEADRNAIRQDAHGLKGTAANFGFRQVSKLAAKLEKDAATIALSGYAATLQSLEISYAATCKHFARLTS